MNKRIAIILSIITLITGVNQIYAEGSNLWPWNWPSNLYTYWYYSEPSTLDTRVAYEQNEQKIKLLVKTIELHQSQIQTVKDTTAALSAKMMTSETEEFIDRCTKIKKLNEKDRCADEAMKRADGWYKTLISQDLMLEKSISALTQDQKLLVHLTKLKSDFEKKIPHAPSAPSSAAMPKAPAKIGCPLERAPKNSIISLMMSKINSSLHKAAVAQPSSVWQPKFLQIRYPSSAGIRMWHSHIHKL